jgi:hypothetical protein
VEHCDAFFPVKIFWGERGKEKERGEKRKGGGEEEEGGKGGFFRREPAGGARMKMYVQGCT